MARLPRPRFTIRRLMTGVAVVGLVAGVGIEGERRRARFETLARIHEVSSLLSDPGTFRNPALSEMVNKYRAIDPDPGLTRRIYEYHAKLGEKYRRSARYPWFPVAVDPPEPR